MKFILSLFFIISSLLFHSQIPNRQGIDSLKIKLCQLDPSLTFINKDTILLLTEIYYRSKELDFKDGQLRALDYRSNTYYNTSKLKEALKDLDEGCQLAAELNDYYQLANMMFGKGYCYTKLGIYDQAMNYFKQGFTYAEKIRNTNQYHYSRLSLYNGMMLNANLSKNYGQKTAIEYAKKVYQEAQLLNDDFVNHYEWVVQSGSNAAMIILYSGGNRLEAEKILTAVEPLVAKVSDRRFLYAYFFAKGLFENKEERYPESIEYYKKAIHICKKYQLIYDLPFTYSELSKSYEAIKDYQHSALYLEQSKNVADSLTQVQNKTVEAVLGKKKETQPAVLSAIYYFAVSAGNLLILIFIYFLWNRRKNTHSAEETEDYSPIIKDDSVEAERKSSLTQLVLTNDQDFYSEFVKAYPGFIQKLLSIDPRFKSSDLEYCALIKLNFDTKQIAIFKNTSIKSVEGKKYRLKKRLAIPPEMNLYIRMSQL